MQNYVGQQIDRYRITERLGMGGMAVVYKAYDTRLERDVALKLIRTGEIPESQHERIMKRFEREAKAQARFQHRHIVPVHDYGEVDGSPYLVMAFIQGGTLKERMHGPVDWRQAVRWLIPVAEALYYAHQRGVIHRDVKPANILFDEEDQPILTDFGIAKVLETDEATLTGTGLGVGTPEYMAPEQWQGKTSEATDQYALGVVLYELITGKKPYSADTPAAVAIQQATEPLCAPRDLVPDIPDEVEKLLYKALARDPQDRFESMRAIHKVFMGLLAPGIEPFVVESPALVAAALEVKKNSEPTKDSEEKTHDVLGQIHAEGLTQPLNKDEGERRKLKKQLPRRVPIWLVWVVGAVLGLSMLVGGISLLNHRWGSPLGAGAEGSEATSTSIETSAIETETDINTSVLMGILGVGSERVNVVDGAVMVYVPAGEFLMGSEDEDADDNEAPEHTVYLDAFWIYQTEVTNDQYRICVEENACSNPKNTYAFDSSKFGNHPVVYINWYQAKEYCEWAGGRLPTEAEWEKSARGTDGRNYPWGDHAPNCSLANYEGCIGSTLPVGSVPKGVSPYGALDMAGNALEWVADWYDENYYRVSQYENPQGPTGGVDRVLRGGSYWADKGHLKVSFREGDFPGNAFEGDGFRCVLSETP